MHRRGTDELVELLPAPVVRKALDPHTLPNSWVFHWKLALPGAYQMWDKFNGFSSLLKQPVLAHFGYLYSYLGTSLVNPTQFYWVKDMVLNPRDKKMEKTVPALSGFIFFWDTQFVTLHITLLKGIIGNHDTKYQRNRDWEWWGLLLALRQVWEEVS